MRPIYSLVGTALLSIGAVVAFAAGGCNVGNEGERCNPDLSHDECGAGLTCTQPKYCPENYCCPTTGTSTNPYCQTGCNGGQASICDAGGDADCDPDAGGDAAVE